MIGRQIQLVRNALDDRQRKRLGKLRYPGIGVGIAADVGSDDDGKFGLGDQSRGLLDSGRGGLPRLRSKGMLVMSASRNSRVREHLSRQCEIDRPARLAHGGVESTIYDRVDGLPMAQLIIPFDEFAHHGALIVSLLAPVNVAVAGGYVTGFRDWRAAGSP